jgi:cold-inducible RNA-binding protein
MARKLFVGNLPFTATEAELHEFFAAAGTCSSVALMTDRMTGRPRGFGFVEMSSDEEAQRAVSQLDGRDFQGRRINVSEARERGAGGPPRSNPAFTGGGGFDADPYNRPRFAKDGGSRRGIRARRRSL